MLRTYSLTNKNIYYYDLEEKCIARFPSKSNLLANGSDNSLYFGNCENEMVKDIFSKLLDTSNIENASGMSFKMKCIDEFVDVLFNVNAEGQVQIKIMKNGSMRNLANNYSMIKMEEYDFTKMLIVIDFKMNEIRFKDPSELSL